MQGEARVLELLNEALRNELTAVNQYWLHYRMLDNWGVERLAAFEREESIGENICRRKFGSPKIRASMS